jgi:hypothetical protein
MSTFDSAKNASSTWELWKVSFITRRKPWSSLCTPGSRGRRSTHHPAMTGAHAPMPMPTSAANSVGRQAISAVPMKSRGTPLRM